MLESKECPFPQVKFWDGRLSDPHVEHPWSDCPVGQPRLDYVCPGNKEFRNA